jgi:hypothetical protein
VLKSTGVLGAPLSVIQHSGDGCFEEDDPRDTDRIGRVAGLQTDTKLVGIDFRPATGGASKVGSFRVPVVDIAIPLDQR